MDQYRHQTTRDYVAAKRRGDTDTTARIVNEVKARTTDGSELAELYGASMDTPLPRPQ